MNEGARPHPNRLVVATHNRGKLEELRALLADLPLEVHGVSELLADPPEVIEDGATFAENALKKARAVARATNMLSLADDSGLEVDALEGRPGVRSARFAHERATDAENNAALLAALEPWADPAASDADRVSTLIAGERGLTARFRCVLALIDPFATGAPPIVEGTCEGAITRTPRGSAGFGYDPRFVVKDEGKTMAELSAAAKNRVSHRAKAFVALRPVLERILAERAAAIARIG
jgi:XTP/dITP diphosphohydrolase